MRRKRITGLLLFTGAIIFAVFTACNPNPSAPDLSLSDAPLLSGGKTVYTEADGTEPDTAFMSGVSYMGDGLSNTETNAEVKGITPRAIVEDFVSKTMKGIGSKEAVMTGSVSGNTVTYRLDVTNHTVNGTDINAVAGGGTMTIPSFLSETKATVPTDTSGSYTITGSTWTQGSFEYNNFTTDGAYIIEGGKSNVGISGSITLTDNGDGSYTLSYNIFVAIKMAATIYDTGTNKGGRFLINAELSSRLSPFTITESTFNDYSYGSPSSLPAEFSATAELAVYDNSGTERYSETYNEENLLNIVTDGSLLF